MVEISKHGGKGCKCAYHHSQKRDGLEWSTGGNAKPHNLWAIRNTTQHWGKRTQKLNSSSATY